MSKNDDILINLPVTRRQLFKFTYRRHLGLLFKLSMFLSLFALPLILVYLIKGSLAADVLKEFNNENIVKYLSTEIYTDLLYIPALGIFSLGLAGSFTLMKQYVFQEGFLFLKSFFLGIKKNGKEFFIVTLIYSIIFYLINFAKNYFAILDVSYFILGTIISAVLLLILLCTALFSYTMIPIYKNSISRTIKNSFFFTTNKMYKIIGIALITIVPLFIIPYINVFFVKEVAGIILGVTLLIYMFIGLGHSVLTSTLYCHHVYDELVNQDNYKELYRKGLYNEDEQ